MMMITNSVLLIYLVLVGMHIEALEEVYRETKDAPKMKVCVMRAKWSNMDLSVNGWCLVCSYPPHNTKVCLHHSLLLVEDNETTFGTLQQDVINA